ncbi:MAG: hypothetical protein ACLSFT_06195 [Ruminococcus callidus]
MGTRRFPVVIDHGAGVPADETGKQYRLRQRHRHHSLGYCNEAWTEAVCKQVKTMQHTSNLYYTRCRQTSHRSCARLPAMKGVLLQQRCRGKRLCH